MSSKYTQVILTLIFLLGVYQCFFSKVETKEETFKVGVVDIEKVYDAIQIISESPNNSALILKIKEEISSLEANLVFFEKDSLEWKKKQ